MIRLKLFNEPLMSSEPLKSPPVTDTVPALAALMFPLRLPPVIERAPMPPVISRFAARFPFLIVAFVRAGAVMASPSSSESSQEAAVSEEIVLPQVRLSSSTWLNVSVVLPVAAPPRVIPPSPVRLFSVSAATGPLTFIAPARFAPAPLKVARAPATETSSRLICPLLDGVDLRVVIVRLEAVVVPVRSRSHSSPAGVTSTMPGPDSEKRATVPSAAVRFSMRPFRAPTSPNFQATGRGAGLAVLEEAMRAALTAAGARLLEAVLAGGDDG